MTLSFYTHDLWYPDKLTQGPAYVQIPDGHILGTYANGFFKSHHKL